MKSHIRVSIRFEEEQPGGHIATGIDGEYVSIVGSEVRVLHEDKSVTCFDLAKIDNMVMSMGQTNEQGRSVG